MTARPTKSAVFHISALHCADEFSLIAKGLDELAGVSRLAPNYVKRDLHVTYLPDEIDEPSIARRLQEIGFAAEIAGESPVSRAPSLDSQRMRLTTLLAGVLLAAAFAAHLLSAREIVVASLAIVSTVLSGWPVARSAWRALRLRHVDMNVLMIVAGAGALATAQWFEGSTAMFLFGVSLWLESYSTGRANRAVRSLLEFTPDIAHRLDLSDGGFDLDAVEAAIATDVALSEIAVGDHVLVKPGERIGVDGIVAAGHSSVNQAPITGESAPVEKAAGDRVFAGSLNSEGALTIRAERTSHDSTLAHIARLVAEAQSSRSPTQRFIDRFAKRYTPAVIALAICLAFGPPLMAWAGLAWPAEPEFREWFHRGLVLLVIACPCALVISTPITIVCGLHRAARSGTLIKGGEFLEAAGRIDCVVFDKTGTLTAGQPRVTRIETADGHTEEQVLRVAAALESPSEHPLAVAILTAARERDGLAIEPAAEFEALRGFGVTGQLGGEPHFVASPRYFFDQKLGRENLDDFNFSGEGAATIALVGTRRRVLGAIHLADTIRGDAADAIAELKRLGVKRVAMLTGDNGAVAARIGHQAGIEHVYAELLPLHKVAQVERLHREFPNLAMVGDGVNDAPALAAARIGIALGSQSSDTALETADIVVMTPRLAHIPALMRLGRHTRRLLMQNIGLALAIKAAVLMLAAAGLATMWMAVAADVGASLLVITNGMRLLKEQSQKDGLQ